MTRWPSQVQALTDVLQAIRDGHRRVCLTSPTGGGKSLVLCDLAEHYADQNLKVVLYTNRRLLVAQMSAVLTKYKIAHGVRSAGYAEDRDELIQISSVQTEDARVTKRKKMELHKAALVLVDEAHLQKGPTVRAILDRHLADGAAVVGVTATPLDLEDAYDHLVVAGTPSELRACGALVPAAHFGADEPDFAALQKQKKLAAEGEDLSEAKVRHAMMTPTIFARVVDWYVHLNPGRKPTLLFAPGVKESLWFAEQLHAAGITAAHIAGDELWVNGAWVKSGTEEGRQADRQKVLDQSRGREINVLCNRFVLREGVDAPWVEHLILATVLGSLQSYLQVGGRGLRAHPGKVQCVVQDHGGHWWRHGSLNADRAWDLRYTAGMVYGLRADRMRDKKDREPLRCPACGQIVVKSPCVCGHAFNTRSRPVVQTDGTLKQMTGDAFRPRRVSTSPSGPALWAKMYFRSLKGKGVKTFRQAMGLYAQENKWFWPDRTWPYMPVDEMDFFKLVPDVPRERLR